MTKSVMAVIWEGMLTNVSREGRGLFRWVALHVALPICIQLCGCGRAPKAPPRESAPPARLRRADFNLDEPVSLEEFPRWMDTFVSRIQWRPRNRPSRLNAQILQRSLALGREFLLKNQRPAGNFNYQYDFVSERMDPGDNQVRQAGALWGMVLIHQFEPTDETRRAIEKGLDFWFERSSSIGEGGPLIISYLRDDFCETGTVALVGLSIIDYLRTVDAGGGSLSVERRAELEEKLRGYIAYLKAMRLENKHFAARCAIEKRLKSWKFSPYYDGETMLCLIKAARYIKGYDDLVPLIDETVLPLAKYYTIDCWRRDFDSDQTKGFFQWSCMAFWEYQDAGWKHADTLADYVLALAWWMVRVHETLDRTRNTGYAYEGIIHSWRIAKARGDEAALAELTETIDQGLYKLTSWQVGGPLQEENHYLRHHGTQDPRAIGGVMNHRAEPGLRIDVTQHQMHAVLLALRHVYGSAEGQGKTGF